MPRLLEAQTQEIPGYVEPPSMSVGTSEAPDIDVKSNGVFAFFEAMKY